jgi:hypothetical protein
LIQAAAYLRFEASERLLLNSVCQHAYHQFLTDAVWRRVVEASLPLLTQGFFAHFGQIFDDL